MKEHQNKPFQILKSLFLWIPFFLWTSSVFTQTDLSKIYNTDTLRRLLKKAQLQKDTPTIGQAAYQIASVTRWTKRTTDTASLELITLSIECFSAIGDSLNLYKSRGTLVGYYLEAKRWATAEKILLGNLGFQKRQQDSSGMVHNLHSLARTYKGMGNLEKAQMYYAKTLELNQTVQDTLIEILTLYEQSSHFQKEKQYDRGIAVAHRAATLSHAFRREDFEAVNLFQMGILHQLQGRLDTAIFYLKEAENIKRTQPYSDLRKQCYLHLASCFFAKKKFEKAYLFSEKYASLLDSISVKKRNDDLDKLTIEHETKQNRAAIFQLEKDQLESAARDHQKNHFLMLLSASLGVLFILLGVVIQFYRDRLKKEKIIIEQAEILNQQKIKLLEDNLQITAVKSMLEGQEKERARIARDLHDSVGGMLSMLKLQIDEMAEKPHQLLNKIAMEVRNIAQNLEPSALQKLGFLPAILDLIDFHQLKNENPNITFQHFKVPENLDKTIALHFYRFIQEALQNAVKHADATEILVQLNGETNGVSILVEDNGKGFDLQKKSTGEGLKNLQKRAEFLKAELTIDSSQTGTSLFLVWQLPS